MAHVLLALPRFHTNLFFAARALTAAGHKVTVLAVHAAALEDHSDVQPIVVGKAPDPRHVAQLVADAAPDLVLVRNITPLSQAVARAARLQRRKCLLYNLAPMTEVPSTARRFLLWRKGMPQNRVTPCPGLDPSAPRDPRATYLPWPVAALPGGARRASDKLRLLCVAKLGQPRKNQDKLIAAIEAAGLEAHVHLTLIGNDDLRGSDMDAGYLQRIMDAGQKDWITVQGPVPYAEMPAVYREHDVIVMPSNDEPLGMAPVEAMAYGLAPVISDASGSAGYLTDGVDGLRVDMRDPVSLEQALTRLVKEPGLADQLGKAALQLAETELSPAHFLQRFEALLL
ncbi:glycosyltransferase family 4 protein [Pseudaestuariivita sp.]|uniref:glycosyltransferase family 4 protein n=1 Tax=Pseudaestuariivita sp. TaxID=2211669 RepID=UPI00405A4955